MSLQVVCAAAKLLSHRWRLLKAGGTTPDITIICLFLWSWACSPAGVWTLLAKTGGWWIGRSQGQRLKTPESRRYTWENVAHSVWWEMEIGTSLGCSWILEIKKGGSPALPQNPRFKLFASPGISRWKCRSKKAKENTDRIIGVFSVWRFSTTLSTISFLFLEKDLEMDGETRPNFEWECQPVSVDLINMIILNFLSLKLQGEFFPWTQIEFLLLNFRKLNFQKIGEKLQGYFGLKNNN